MSPLAPLSMVTLSRRDYEAFLRGAVRGGCCGGRLKRAASETGGPYPPLPATSVGSLGLAWVRSCSAREIGGNIPVDFPDRAAHNEEVFRTINERIEEGAKRHDVKGEEPAS
jgi:hypothetical protein